jgi:serine/threonine protein kinase
MTPNEPETVCEPSDQFLELVVEIDSALHQNRTVELDSASLVKLSAHERLQLEQSRKQLEMLYGGSPTNDRAEKKWSGHLGILDSHFGRFEILRGLGMGGEGVVFLARDPVLGRFVALKVPRPDVLVDASRRKRFLTEGRAAALLTHPNIVTVFESGEVGTICYLAQDYIAGPSLADWLRDHSKPVSATTAARVMLQLAEAVLLAHSRKILHRDIKPGNILLSPRIISVLTENLDHFVPKLSDFGLAKLSESADATQTAGFLGTPAYMSPEQAEGGQTSIGVATDIYSLGAVLYELLTHQKLFHGETSLEIIQQVLHRDPPHPRAIVPNIPRDIEAICLKCLRRAPADRYRSAEELADDVRRFLDDRPVLARPLSWSKSFYRWSTRNPAIAALGSIVVLTFLCMLFGSLWFNSRLNDSLQIIKEHQTNLRLRTLELRRRVYAADLSQAASAWQDGRATEARDRLAACIPQQGESDLRSFPWWMLARKIKNSSHVIGTIEEGAVSASVAISPDGNVLATGEPDGVIRLRALPEGRLIGELRGHETGNINSLEFLPRSAAESTVELPGTSQTDSPTSSNTIAKSESQLLLSAGDDGSVRVWDVRSQSQLHDLRGHQHDVLSAIFVGKDAEAIASGGVDRIIRIWDRRSGQLLSELKGHTDIIRSLQEHAATGILYSAAEDCTIRIWDWKSAMPDLRLPDGRFDLPSDVSYARSLALSPDGTELTAGFRSGRLMQWYTTAKNRPFGKLHLDLQFSSGFRALTWRDDSTLLAGSGDSRILLQQMQGGDNVDKEFLAGHSDWILSFDTLPDGNGLISVSKDGTIRYWPRETFDGNVRIPPESGNRHSWPNWNNSVLTVVMDNSILGYQIPTESQRFQLSNKGIQQGTWTSLTVDGSRLLTTLQDDVHGSILTSIEIATGRHIWQLPVEKKHSTDGAFSYDGNEVFLGADQELWSVDVATGEKNWTTETLSPVTNVATVPRRP